MCLSLGTRGGSLLWVFLRGCGQPGHHSRGRGVRLKAVNAAGLENRAVW